MQEFNPRQDVSPNDLPGEREPRGSFRHRSTEQLVLLPRGKLLVNKRSHNPHKPSHAEYHFATCHHRSAELRSKGSSYQAFHIAHISHSCRVR